ncbi:MAG: MFS transporter, partial [Calditrichota bacterium]
MNDADQRRVALLISSLASFMTPFMVSSVNIALPIMGRELTMNAVGLGWVGSAYLLGAAVFLVPFGRLADLYGRKRIFVQGVAVYCLSSFALAAVPNAALLIALRVVQGISASTMFGTSVAL